MSEPLPRRSRLLHVGLTKTGTTALQNVASRRRADLLRHGVRYPGRRYNHRQAAFALYRRGERHAGPRPDAWDELQGELAGEQHRRILISNEFIAGWDDAVAARFVDQVGARTHVVITLRSFGALLPSIWQQYVKSGSPTGFEDLLDLPAGMLDDPTQGGSDTNRSLSAEEAGLLLAVNRILAAYRVEEEDLVRIVRRGATARFLDECPAPDPQSTLALPPWAADAAAARGREFAAAIDAAGVNVIGDLAELGRVPHTRPGRWTSPDTVSTEVAAQALVGALSAGLGRGSNLGLPARTRPRSPSRTTARLIARILRFSGLVRRRL